MCGRFDLHTPPSRWAARLGAAVDPGLDACLAPSDNVPPGRSVLMVVADTQGQLRLDLARWGIPAPWSSPAGRSPLLFNARAETITAKAPFRRLVPTHRCAVPADAFYEWRHDTGPDRHRPFAFTRADGEPLLLAGLWQTQVLAPGEPASGEPVPGERVPGEPASGEPVPACCTVITTEAGPDVADVHHRMPVVLDLDQMRRWLRAPDDGADLAQTGEILSFLRPAAVGTLVSHRVAALVSRAPNAPTTPPQLGGSAPSGQLF